MAQPTSCGPNRFRISNHFHGNLSINRQNSSDGQRPKRPTNGWGSRSCRISLHLSVCLSACPSDDPLPARPILILSTNRVSHPPDYGFMTDALVLPIIQQCGLQSAQRHIPIPHCQVRSSQSLWSQCILFSSTNSFLFSCSGKFRPQLTHIPPRITSVSLSLSCRITRPGYHRTAGDEMEIPCPTNKCLSLLRCS